MTVSTTDSVIEYVSGGPAFPIPYRFLLNSDIQAVLVKQDGTSETLALGTQYTLSGAGSQGGGTLTSAYASSILSMPGATLTISRVMNAVQPTDLRNQGRYFAETHENVFDRLTMLIQQGFSGLSRALLRPIGKNYYDAEGRNISNIANPINNQDAATKASVAADVAAAIGGAQGDFNLSSNVFYSYGSPGAVSRNVSNRLRERVSVKDFGAVGDGIVDDSAAFLAAHTNVAAGVEIYVPPGTYRFASNVTVTRRNFFFNGSSITGPGRLVGALTRMIDPVTGGVSYGVGEPYQYGSYYKFGSNVAGPIGLVVGGADPRFGVDGNALFADSYGGWSAFSPTRYLSSCEFAVQPASSAGSCTTLVGGNVVTRTGGGEFLAEFVGRRIYIDQGRYRVASVNVPAQTLTVTELNGTPVVFSVPGPFTFVFVGVKGSGTCNVSGTAVTRVTGDPFVPFGNTEYLFYLNGVSNQATAVSDYNNLTLLNPAVSGTNVPYEFWTSIDDLSSAVRVHRVAGAGFEENLTLGAYAAGYFHVHSAGGGGRQYPMYLGTGYDGASLKRRQVGLQTNGRITLGGDADKCSLVIEDGGGSATNYLVVSGSAVSGSGTPSLSAQGASTNIGIAVSTKGNLSTKFSSGNFSSIEFEISSNTAGTSWLAVRSDAYNQPRLYADGASANIDIRLIPKGTGRVMIGPYTAGSGTINGWIEVKDSTGSLRKVAILT